MEIGSLVIGAGESGESKHGGPPKVPRERILKNVHEFLEEHDCKNGMMVGEIAAAAGVCSRGLRTAFNERYGVGPVRYLQLMRLHKINRDLRAADCEVETVTDVFVRNGEWEFGRLAARYRALFGELPSETLRGSCF